MLILRKPWVEQPQDASDIDWSNGLTRGLQYLRLPNQQPIIGGNVTATGAIGVSGTAKGLANTFSSSYLQATSTTALPFTLGAVAYTNAVGVSQTLLSVGNTGAASNYWQVNINADGTIRAATRNTTFISVSTAGAVTANVPFVAAGVYESSTSRRAFLNGELSAAETTSSTPTGTTLRVGVIARSTLADYLNGGTLLEARWDRALSQEELGEWYRNPWQLFAPRSIWVPVSVGGGGSTGTVAYTNANDTSAGSGTTTVTGTLAKTNANDTVSASGTTTVVGTLATTNADDTCAASGTVGSSGSTGTVAYTNANDTSAAAGTTTVTGTVARTNADDSVSASGWVGAITGTLNVTNANDTASASGTVTGGARRHAGYKREQVRKGYIIKGKRYWLTEDELMAMVAHELTAISRKEVKQITQGKPKPISKKVWDLIQPMERLEAITPVEEQDDEDDVLMMFV